MLDIYIYENEQLLEKLESLFLVCEKNESFSSEQVADIFRILHTIKGSSAMMNFDNIANLSHSLEDLFDYLRENEIREEDHQQVCDYGFQALDIINAEMVKIQNNDLPDGNADSLINEIKELHTILTNRKTPSLTEVNTSISQADIPFPYEDGHCYKATIRFQNDCKMESIRALGVVKAVETLCYNIITLPKDLLEESSSNEIALNGFTLYMLSAEPKDELLNIIQKTFFIEDLEFEELDESEVSNVFNISKTVTEETNTEDATAEKETSDKVVAEKTAQKTIAADHMNTHKQSFMSVNLNKLDSLMDIVGEIVIAESTVTKNPELTKLQLESFEKTTRQLHKLTDELQDLVMSLRMVPVSGIFRKMERIVRDMSSKINKKAELIIVGEDTELDKNVLDNLADPLMHIIRNSMDHGLEPAEERISKGKNPVGEIRLEARNAGGNVTILASDDGRGLNKEKLIEKGIQKGLIKKPKSEVSDSEAYSLIFSPGFSTKTDVTEFSGRGVGMDVALENIKRMGGSVFVDSKPDEGMRVQIRIPLTLAIIDGMQVSVGDQSYIIPVLAIKQCFKPNKKDLFFDTNGNENIYIRGNCYPIVRLYKLFDIDTAITECENGILILVENESETYCIFVDNLVGEQQAVVKPIPLYISKTLGHIKSITGCTILGDGSISLIVDINGLSR